VLNVLCAFIDQVGEFIAAGLLTPAEGQPLIAGANGLISALGG
jgi:hypothetical protein